MDRIKWTSANNSLWVARNATVSFCPGSMIDGTMQPYLVGPMLPDASTCMTIQVSIANARVYHLALHTGSDSGREYGLHAFPRSVLRQLNRVARANWLSPSDIPEPPSGIPAIPKNFSLRFGAHRNSINGGTAAGIAGPLTPYAPDSVRAAHAAALPRNHPVPEILDYEFPDYKSTLDKLPEEPPPHSPQTLGPLAGDAQPPRA
jgi:hypothetical protein